MEKRDEEEEWRRRRVVRRKERGHLAEQVLHPPHVGGELPVDLPGPDDAAGYLVQDGEMVKW